MNEIPTQTTFFLYRTILFPFAYESNKRRKQTINNCGKVRERKKLHTKNCKKTTERVLYVIMNKYLQEE